MICDIFFYKIKDISVISLSTLAIQIEKTKAMFS